MSMDRKPRKIWDNIKPIGEVQKAPSTKLKVDLAARDGVKYVVISEWYKTKGSEVYKPSGKVHSVPIAYPNNGEVIHAAMKLFELVEKSIQEAPDFALEDKENEVWG